MTMAYSKDGMQLTEDGEGCRLRAYRDSGGVWTIGVGHTGGVAPGQVCTIEQATAWLAADIKWAEYEVNRRVNVPLTQAEFDALVDFTFNAGRAGFDHSTLLRLVNQGDTRQAANEFEKWDKAGGKVVAGLLRRRLLEKNRFITH